MLFIWAQAQTCMFGRERMPDYSNRLLFKDLVRLTSDNSDYAIYECEDVLRAFLDVVRRELYSGKSLLFEKLFRLEVYKPKSKRMHNLITGKTEFSPAHPKIRLTPTIGLLDYIREMPESSIQIKEGTPIVRAQHHTKTRRKMYDPETRKKYIKDKAKRENHLPNPN